MVRIGDEVEVGVRRSEEECGGEEVTSGGCVRVSY